MMNSHTVPGQNPTPIHPSGHWHDGQRERMQSRAT